MFDRLKQIESPMRQIETEIMVQIGPLGPEDRSARAELQGLLETTHRLKQQFRQVLEAREARWMQRAKHAQQSRLVDLERTGSLARQVRRAEKGMSARPLRLG